MLKLGVELDKADKAEDEENTIANVSAESLNPK